jgi:hypothetical protein
MPRLLERPTLSSGWFVRVVEDKAPVGSERRTEMSKCKTCKFFILNETQTSGSPQGTCHRFPPLLGLFPATTAGTVGCGEHTTAA